MVLGASAAGAPAARDADSVAGRWQRVIVSTQLAAQRNGGRTGAGGGDRAEAAHRTVLRSLPAWTWTTRTAQSW